MNTKLIEQAFELILTVDIPSHTRTEGMINDYKWAFVFNGVSGFTQWGTIGLGNTPKEAQFDLITKMVDLFQGIKRN